MEDRSSPGEDKVPASNGPQAGSGQANDSENDADGLVAAPKSGDPMDADEAVRICQAVLSAGEDELQRDVFDLAQDALRLSASQESPMTLPTADDPPRDDRCGAGLLAKSVSESGRIRATLRGRRDGMPH